MESEHSPVEIDSDGFSSSFFSSFSSIAGVVATRNQNEVEPLVPSPVSIRSSQFPLIRSSRDGAVEGDGVSECGGDAVGDAGAGGVDVPVSKYQIFIVASITAVGSIVVLFSLAIVMLSDPSSLNSLSSSSSSRFSSPFPEFSSPSASVYGYVYGYGYGSHRSRSLLSLSCPFPLVVPDNPTSPNILPIPNVNVSCAIPCPSPVFLDSEWQTVHREILGLSVISFVMCLFMLLTWIIFPVKRQQSHLLMFNVCIFSLAVSFLFGFAAVKGQSQPLGVPGSGTIAQIGCKNNSERISQADGGYCVWQGFWIHYFSNAAAMWWAILTLDLYAKIVLGLKQTPAQKKKWSYFYHGAAWGFSAFLSIILAGLGEFGGQPTAPWCFISAKYKASEYVLFYAPLFSYAIVGAYCMGSTLFVMVKSSIRTNASSRKSSWWKQYVRPLLFLFQFSFIFVFIVAFRLHVEANSNDYSTSLKNWVVCLFVSPGQCGSKPPIHPDLGLFYAFCFVTSGQGLINGISYGSQKSNFLLWYGLLTGRGVNYDGVKSSRFSGKLDEAESEEKERSTGKRPGGGSASGGSGVGVGGSAISSGAGSVGAGIAIDRNRMSRKAGGPIRMGSQTNAAHSDTPQFSSINGSLNVSVDGISHASISPLTSPKVVYNSTLPPLVTVPEPRSVQSMYTNEMGGGTEASTGIHVQSTYPHRTEEAVGLMGLTGQMNPNSTAGNGGGGGGVVGFGIGMGERAERRRRSLQLLDVDISPSTQI